MTSFKKFLAVLALFSCGALTFAQDAPGHQLPQGRIDIKKNGRPTTVIYDDVADDAQQGLPFEELDEEDKLQVVQAQGEHIGVLQHNLAALKQRETAHEQEKQNLHQALVALKKKPAQSGWDKNKDLCYGSALGVSLIAVYLLTDHIHGKKFAVRGYTAVQKACVRGKEMGARACTAVGNKVVQGKNLVVRLCASGLVSSKELTARAWAAVQARLQRSKELGAQACTAVGNKVVQGKDFVVRVCTNGWVNSKQWVARVYAAMVERAKRLAHRTSSGTTSPELKQ